MQTLVSPYCTHLCVHLFYFRGAAGAGQSNLLRERPRAGRLSGPPGAGKSTCLRYMAYQWSVDFLEKTQNTDTIDSDECTLMVYLPARSMRGSVRDAIRNQLRCEEKDADLLMAHVDQGKGVAILVDGIDEIRDPEIIENLREYVQTRKKRGGHQVLVAARTNLSQLPSQSFDRFLVLQGFSPEQGKQYIKKYFSMDRPHKVTIQAVMDYIKMHESQLNGVLMNPLQLYIFCGLTSIGVLKLEDYNIYNVVNLFEPLEKFLIKRESEKRGSLPPTEKDSQNFYCMCLYALLADVRRFAESHLKKFKIVHSYYVFYSKRDELCSTAEYTTYYEFKHEAIFEYFGSKLIQNSPLAFLQSLILSICCRKSLRNVQKMMMEIVAKRDDDSMPLYRAIIRAIIIFQWDEHRDGDNSTSESDNDIATSESEFVEASGSADDHSPSSIIIGLSNLKHKIKMASVDEMLLSHQNADKVREADAIWKEVNRVFDSEGQELRAEGWFESEIVEASGSADDHDQDVDKVREAGCMGCLSCWSDYPTDVREVDVIWEINRAFDNKAKVLRAMGWFRSLEMNGTIEHIVDCLRVCTPQQQEEIIRRSLYCLLPCEFISIT